MMLLCVLRVHRIEEHFLCTGTNEHSGILHGLCHCKRKSPGHVIFWIYQYLYVTGIYHRKKVWDFLASQSSYIKMIIGKVS